MSGNQPIAEHSSPFNLSPFMRTPSPCSISTELTDVSPGRLHQELIESPHAQEWYASVFRDELDGVQESSQQRREQNVEDEALAADADAREARAAAQLEALKELSLKLNPPDQEL